MFFKRKYKNKKSTLIYLIDNHRMTYEDFKELTEISPSEFSNTIKVFKNMLNDLKLNMIL